MSTEQRKTTCNRDCPDACAIVATIETGPTGERVTRLDGDRDHPITQGFLCYRTNQFLATQYAPDRLLTPLYRERIGDPFRSIEWKEALDIAAEKLLRFRRESGPASIFHYRSGGSLGLLTLLTDHFFSLFGPVTSKRGDICSGAGDAAQMTDFGEEDSHDLFDLLNSKSIVLWGKNVFTSSPHTIPVLKQAKARGARLVLVDPVHHKTATLTDEFLQPRPGGDVALALAVARVLFTRALTDGNVQMYCDGVAEFRALAETRSVDEWCAIADVTRGEAESLAETIAARPCAILVGWGMGRRAHGAAIVRALDALCAISGNLGIAGGGVSFYFKRRGAFATERLSQSPPPRTVCEPLLGEEVLAMRDPPIRALWITAGNPVAMLPDSRTVERALASREFTVVVDSFLTDSARAAHLVLPTTTLLEADDLLGSYGHHYLGAARPVIAPPASVRSDLEIMQGLAERTGLADAMEGSARKWKERLVAGKLAPRGVTLEQLEAGATRNPLAPKVLFADRQFPTATGRVNLMTSAPESALTVNPLDNQFPLILMALATDKSQSSQWAHPPTGHAVATIHPASAPAGLVDGSTCTLATRVGEMTVRLRFDAKQRRDVVLVAKGGQLKDGRCANALVKARTTDMGEGAAYYDESARLKV